MHTSSVVNVAARIPLIKFIGARLPRPHYDRTSLPPLNIAPIAVAASSTKASSIGPVGTIPRGQGVDESQLPAYFKRRPISEDEIDAINEPASESELAMMFALEEQHRDELEQEILDYEVTSSGVSTCLPESIVETAKELRAKTGRLTYRRTVYGNELKNSDMTQPPSVDNPHPFDPSGLPPAHSHTLVPFVNHSTVLRTLVDLQMNLFEVENTTNIARHLMKLTLKDVKQRVDWLKHIGFKDSEIGPYLTRNPYVLLQELEDLKTRVNYMELKRWSPSDVKNIVDGYRYWINCDVKLIDSRLGWIQKQFRLKAKEVRELVVKEPRIIMFGTGPMQRIFVLLNNELGYTEKEVKEFLLTDPRVFMIDPKILQKNYRYIVDVMRVDKKLVLKNPLLIRSALSSIKSRHEFLKKCKQAEYDSVKIRNFLAKSDAEFAVKAAGTYLVVFDKFLRNS